jgi:HD superfamily phosphohydrolase
MGMKEIRDPVHSFIYLTEDEMKIVNTLVFQRLRYIRQLAFTHLVYPGAEHSRFAHSLGVMEFATRMFDTLMSKPLAKELKWKKEQRERNRQLLRLGALLHDIGHAPFSHASEELLPGLSHEEITRRLILEDPIKSLIDRFKQDFGITAKDVASFFSPKNIDPDIAFLKEIFSGEVDADKLDYLYRDSLFTGVHYGRFDYQRLIQSLCLIEHPETGDLVMAIEHGGLHALEAMVLARYFMFTQVYFHKVRRAYDHHLLEFLTKYVKRYPKSLEKYLRYDDNVIFALLREHHVDENSKRILRRNPFVQAFTTPEHINEEERTRFYWLKENLQRRFKNNVKLFYDTAEKSPHKFKQFGTYVLSPSTGSPALVHAESGIIRSLKNIEQYSVFTPRENKQEVHDFCTGFWKDHAGGGEAAATVSN